MVYSPAYHSLAFGSPSLGSGTAILWFSIVAHLYALRAQKWATKTAKYHVAARPERIEGRLL